MASVVDPKSIGTPLKKKKRTNAASKKSSSNSKKEKKVDNSNLTSKWLNRKQFENMGVEYKKGVFTNDEKERIKQALLDYQRLHNLDSSKLQTLIYGRHSLEHKNFWPYIATHVGTRPIRTLAIHIQREFHPFNYTGSWSSEEDEKLKGLVEIYYHDWTAIGHQMNRTGQQCRDRWRDY
ncbi:18321_t:CDS:2, partial [Acaulospora morrowiae]